MTEITFGTPPASADKLIAGLAGGTGSGKTFSALEIGTGLVSDPATELFLIDTEYGRAAHYRNQFAFQYGRLAPPFTAERYQAAIEKAIDSGAKCIIVDSLSHMWEGEGGARQQAAKIAEQMAARSGGYPEKYSFPSWNKPKESITQFELFLQRCPVPLILCLRAKEKSAMVTKIGQDGRSKTDIVSQGLQPIMEDGLPYECTFLAMLTPQEPGEPHWTVKRLANYLQPIFDGEPKRLSREHGRRLAAWCGGSAGVAQSEEQPPREWKVAGSTPAASTRMSKKRAEEIMAALRDAPNVEALDQLWSRRTADIITASVEGQRAIKRVYDETRAGLEAIEGRPTEPFDHGEFDSLEPPEWLQAEGRVEDERQQELLPE